MNKILSVFRLLLAGMLRPMAGKYMPVRELKIILNLPLPLLTMTEIHVLYCVMFLPKVRQ